MRGTRRTIESRLFDAVLLVLASAGCQPAPPATRETGPDPLEIATSSADAGVAVVATGDDTIIDGGAAPHESAPVDGGAAIGARPADAQAHALCASYQSRSRPDPKKAKTQHRYGGGASASTAYWDPRTGTAVCSIVHQTVADPIEVTRTPTCCPQGRGTQPCPPSYKTMAPATRQLVEHATVRADGTVAKSVVTWYVSEDQPERRHNCGRRPEGLRFAGRASTDTDEIGAQLAAMAELEAASVPAFERLARELAMHGAPDDLVRRAQAAMRDEVRHATAMTALAARFGHVPRAVDVPQLPCRPLAAIARENAIEGCVREAYGALVATYQAESAMPELRGAFRAIARDERRHAALAEDVHAWIMAALDAPAREVIERARRATEHELRASLAETPECPTLGIPGGARAVALFDAYFA
ncbi:MAG: hypothetical protein H0T89_07760 [Deltaproteobacteria bacterium]|nr:hypothetical protein [Deltaproteobacteria bacterium]MDQ3297034.1 hypothetical protein [Myxococcota bacterium]